jgi:hypothetical protein
MRSPPRWIPALAALIWVSWILFLGLDDRRNVVGLSGTSSEALQHVVAFAVLGALVMLTARQRPWIVLGLVGAAAVVGEFAQLAAPDRTFSLVDTAFSLAGAVIGVALVRGSGWWPTIAVVSSAGLMIAAAPVTLESSVDGVAASLPEGCSEAPRSVGGPPQVVLDAEWPAGAAAALPVTIESPTSAEIRERVAGTDEFSAAVEFSTTSLSQEGPVRLFTISNGTGSEDVNFHIGLEHDDLSVRLRTSCDLFTWIVVPDVVTAGPRHRVVVTWGAGTLEVWLDAVKVDSVSLPWGGLETWDPAYPIVVGDEAGGGRRFDGSVYVVTMWDRPLDDADLVADRPS